MTSHAPQIKKRGVGCITKAGLVLIPLLLATLVLQRIWGDLQTPEGQSYWLGKLLETLRSENTYIFLGVLAVNVWLYTRLTNWLYPTGGHIVRGLASAVSAVKSDDTNLSDDRDAGAGWGHAFLIFVLPFLFFATGRYEYRYIQKLLSPRTCSSPEAPGVSHWPAVQTNTLPPAVLDAAEK